MKEVLKLTTVTGEKLYIRESYNINAVCQETQGEMKFTSVHMLGVAFRVKESAQEVATLLGWEPKQVEAPKA